MSFVAFIDHNLPSHYTYKIAYAPFTLLRPLRDRRRSSLMLMLLLILILSGIHVLLTPLLLRLLPLLWRLLSMVVVVIVSVDA